MNEGHKGHKQEKCTGQRLPDAPPGQGEDDKHEIRKPRGKKEGKALGVGIGSRVPSFPIDKDHCDQRDRRECGHKGREEPSPHATQVRNKADDCPAQQEIQNELDYLRLSFLRKKTHCGKVTIFYPS